MKTFHVTLCTLIIVAAIIGAAWYVHKKFGWPSVVGA